jgi:hypothetical protein
MARLERAIKTAPIREALTPRSSRGATLMTVTGHRTR